MVEGELESPLLHWPRCFGVPDRRKVASVVEIAHARRSILVRGRLIASFVHARAVVLLYALRDVRRHFSLITMFKS